MNALPDGTIATDLDTCEQTWKRLEVDCIAALGGDHAYGRSWGSDPVLRGFIIESADGGRSIDVELTGREALRVAALWRVVEAARQNREARRVQAAQMVRLYDTRHGPNHSQCWAARTAAEDAMDAALEALDGAT